MNQSQLWLDSDSLGGPIPFLFYFVVQDGDGRKSKWMLILVIPVEGFSSSSCWRMIFLGRVISASLIFLPLGRGIFETGSVPSVDGTGSFPTFLIPWVCFTSVPRPEEDMSSVPCAHRSNPDLLRWGNWRLNGLSSGSTFISPLPFHRGLWDLASVSILLIAPPLWGTQLAGFGSVGCVFRAWSLGGGSAATVPLVESLLARIQWLSRAALVLLVHVPLA